MNSISRLTMIGMRCRGFVDHKVLDLCDGVVNP